MLLAYRVQQGAEDTLDHLLFQTGRCKRQGLDFSGYDLIWRLSA